MNESAKSITIGILKAVAVLFGVCILIWFLFKIQALILFIGIAVVVSLIGRPIAIFLRSRLKMGNTMASIVVLLFLLSFFSLLLWIFIPILVEQGKNISEIDFDSVRRDLNELNMQAADYLGFEKLDLVEAIKRTEFVQNFDVEVVPSFIDIFFGNIGNALIGLFSILFISFFILKDEKLIPNTVTTFAQPGSESKFLRILTKNNELLSRYFIGLIMQICILALFYSILLLFLDVNSAVAVALICAFLNIVPYLGPVIGWLLMMLVIVSNNLGSDFSSDLLPLILWATGGYAIAQIFDNFITQPVIFSRSVRSHPLEIFLIILIGGFVFGIPGMILAVPTYTALKVFSKEFFSEYKIVKRLTRNF